MAGLRFVYKKTKETEGGDYASGWIAFAKNSSSLILYLVLLLEGFLRLLSSTPTERHNRLSTGL